MLNCKPIDSAAAGAMTLGKAVVIAIDFADDTLDQNG